MTDAQRNDPRLHDDRTRDITLPPLPGRPPPALPKEWADLSPDPAPQVPPTEIAVPSSEATAADAPTLRAFPGEDPRLPDQPTDKVGSPRLRVRPPERTLAFSSPEMHHRPVDPVQVGRAPRRWPWFVLTLLPLLIIAGAGITLVLLLRG
jgi:hypothetical protein